MSEKAEELRRKIAENEAEKERLYKEYWELKEQLTAELRATNLLYQAGWRIQYWDGSFYEDWPRSMSEIFILRPDGSYSAHEFDIQDDEEWVAKKASELTELSVSEVKELDDISKAASAWGIKEWESKR